MVDLEKAYKIANGFFLDNDYVGVHEIRENADSWLFVPQCKSACYGVANVCIPKNGDEPYVFSTAEPDGAAVWNSAKAVSYRNILTK
nr:MAG TPA: immunity protein [Caudoviricetes sp.]